MAEEIQKNNEEKLEEKEKPEEIDELSKCQKERDEYLDGWKRAKADLINYKKDEAKRFEAIVKFSNESLVRELINVLDSFDLALVALENEADLKKERGLYLIRQQLEDILKQNGLERIIISVGQPFDPALQEAVAEVESDKPSSTIIEEVERGYLLNGKLIRPARVKVSK
ncbi:nucleotide exchange factor GrpE [Candidatus Wolfebacteria bacterium CG18_big_fil_WC_8_21_14_2_50_39_7]|uniref:Protein GrpE n=5 Tax=Candidatus Wolfeibacteriota TaxID=1752735 RepID=A0A2M7Q6V1_9BACT|nr:nucleotide exchange factor GrpE [Parcubacteria group bacterium]NCO89428.1 nucleotide exchange factor GrpE [Candidatus Wolfebacteria bacterium]OIO65619.1 MAG: nucleotide exchange factor GrpE [Candidatus Wolfebacteria bacterium CG1_02_39_135]PIP92060.1 MAG: nucleotide exchange factor GrpE [Candidatus Wolfebacteria bacterium CG18_big_fil_WC_8_21_14_2_50_39_7]PIU98878.1 MAG: nucleotide exchange factor GrpE [Candidatus Wolfebacteria bacterium CG03_land_8_20_14_0_80_39_317]PIY58832.1 MAG: nucleot